MEDVKPEEKSPLLFNLIEENGNNNCNKTNKRMDFDKGRLYGISSGATAVFTDFPNYMSPCWITTLISSIIFFMMVLFMVSTIPSANKIRFPRCNLNKPEAELNNRTIHLVHRSVDWTKEQLDILENIKKLYKNYNVHLVLIKPQLNTISSGIKKTNISSNNATIINKQDLLLLKNNSDIHKKLNHPLITGMNQALIDINRVKRNITKKNSKKFKKKDVFRGNSFGFNFGTILDILLHKVNHELLELNNSNEITYELPKFLKLTETTSPPPKPKTLNDIIENFPKLLVENVTLEEFFHNTPLKYAWHRFNPDLAIFAIRILHLWDYGGISFKINDDNLPKNYWEKIGRFSIAPASVPTKSYKKPLLASANENLHNFIEKGIEIYENLPNEVVTADDESLHILTKTPCHAFFGEIIRNLKYSQGTESPKILMLKSLKIFCKHSAVSNNYCKNLIRSTL